MTLATCTSKGKPSARIVLYKGLDSKGLRFFTNYQSRKSRELLDNPYAALVFYWHNLDKQIRIEGKVQKLPESDSDEYWNSRPRESQIGGIASLQSKPLANRKLLETKIDQLEKKWEGTPIPRPKNWGGFNLIPSAFEFWILGDHRIHDRYLYKRSGKTWKSNILYP